MICYNCGRPVSDKSNIIECDDIKVEVKNHPEHVPAKCFYVDATDEQKKNLITVS